MKNKPHVYHGQSTHPLYFIWKHMVDRCSNPRHLQWGHYGGRGIAVCKEWLDSPLRFFADMGSRPSSRHSLDRINNDGNYEPSNCRWATLKEQNRNRRNNRLITFQGRTQTLAAWSEETGLTQSTITSRLELRWPIEDALTTGLIPRSAPFLLEHSSGQRRKAG